MSVNNISRLLSLYDSFSDGALRRSRADIGKYQEQLSTGLQINRPSDDPQGFSQARRMEVLQDRYAQYQRGVGSARTWVNMTQESLDEMVELLMDASEQAVRISNETFDAADRAIMADRIEAIKDEVFSLYNARLGDEFLFAGTASTEPAFSRSGTTVTYEGNDADRLRDVGPDTTLSINITGTQLDTTSEGGSVMDALQTMIDAVNADDTAAIQTAIDDMNKARDHVIDVAGTAGSVGRRLDTLERQLMEQELLATQRRSLVEDADVAEAVIGLQKGQTALQAALQATATVRQLTLLDYIR